MFLAPSRQFQPSTSLFPRQSLRRVNLRRSIVFQQSTRLSKYLQASLNCDSISTYPYPRYKSLTMLPKAAPPNLPLPQDFLTTLTSTQLSKLPADNREYSTCKDHFRTFFPQKPAEESLRLPCTYIFAHRCLKKHLGQSYKNYVRLISLDFSPGSNGAELGAALKTHLQSNNRHFDDPDCYPAQFQIIIRKLDEWFRDTPPADTNMLFNVRSSLGPY
ncbi:hypothetical protein K432DRAFT_5357 [Lepidopterella palustris CBS 459.81]|uniref:Uncharacterized protein n=1 Tax=Lepidopterella palustris CBS 459.81 TaxID=1314670 RepID=A0A8E2EDK6_9PEZI|nr:hypothetical protein K432DRAFT_5357 [Lepidopterella palustris CBS 459.81]